jgi:hypothetical protein
MSTETFSFIYNDKDFDTIECIKSTKKHLYNNIYLYIVQITYSCHDAKNKILNNAYIKLIFNYQFNLNYKNNIKNLCEIISEYVMLTLQLEEVETNTKIENDGSTTFIPWVIINEHKYNVYVSPYNKILNILLPIWFNQVFVSTSNLTEYAYEKVYKKYNELTVVNDINNSQLLIRGNETSKIYNSNKLLKTPKLHNYNGMYCINDGHQNFYTQLYNQINYLQKNSYMILHESQILDELCQLWPVEKIKGNIYKSDFSEEWIDEAIMLISNNNLINYTLMGNWMLLVN